jgi:hypothetical protein
MNSNILAEMTPLRRKLIDNLQLWRALDLEDIKSALNYEKSERSFRRFLLRTKNAGLISSKRVGPNRRNCYFLNKLVHGHLVDSQGPVNDNEVYHDVLTSKYIMSFMKTYKVENFDISPYLKQSDVLAPDATLGVHFPSGLKNIAVEMELTRKSIKRYLSKFKVYDESPEYDLTLYIFNDTGIFNSYKERLKADFQDLKNCKIVLILNTTLCLQGVDQLMNNVFAFGEDVLLDDIFSRYKEL